MYKFKVSRLTLERMYFAFIRPIMEYADVVWAGAHDKDLVKLDRLQLQAMRIVTGAPRNSSITELYKELGWPELSIRRDHHTLSMFYKILNNMAPSYLKELMPSLVKDGQPYNLRNNDDFVAPFCRLLSYERSFFPRGLDLWNVEDESFLTCTISAFNYKLKKVMPNYFEHNLRKQ